MRWILVGLFLVLAGWALPGAASADHDRARDAVAAGEVRPLGTIMARLSRRYPGRLLDARLARRGGNGAWIYHIKILNRRGAVVALTVDGRSGRVLKVRGR